ncbi:MAG: gliding motility-associated C-terminal domain-containing protein [Bacteroidia bacterium]|nr:gliding motility-associated C-terminal domain-containing protein [Bacteroidia bacterium]
MQLKDQAGVFQTIRTIGGGITKVDSINIESYQLDSICFRVFAVKDSSTFDTSWSNEVCLVPSSYVYVPTAFSPDDNRLNEIFKPVSAYIHQNSDDPNERYEFRIYNRWGQLVFETNDPKLGWDGRFGGELSQTGLYIWSLKALGFDGVPHRINGTVYLMR